MTLDLDSCCPENPAANKIEVGIGCSTEYTFPIVGQIIKYYGYCYTITNVSSANEGCRPTYQYYNTCSDCGPCITPTPTVTPTNTATSTGTPTNTATSIPDVCNQYRIENNTESSISISWFECDDNIFYDVLESGNQITFCANQFYGLINYSSGSLFDLGLCPTPTPTSTATPTATPTSSGGGGGGGTPSNPSSVYFDGDAITYINNYSYLESSGVEPNLSIDPIVKGFTFSTWVKSNWLPGLGYPADFMKMSAPSLSTGCGTDAIDRITLSYDSETYQDGIFIEAVWCQSDSYKSVLYWAGVSDPTNGNDSITNLSQPPGTQSPWNSGSNSQFINITFTIDGNAGFVNNPGDQSQSGVIYWNGQALYTQESPPASGSTSMFLSSFNSGSAITLGGWRWARAHWQDQTLFYDGVLNQGAINSVLYAGGLPVSDVTLALGRGTMFNYNEPYTDAWLDSSGVPIITLNGVNLNLVRPFRDPNTYVA